MGKTAVSKRTLKPQGMCKEPRSHPLIRRWLQLWRLWITSKTVDGKGRSQSPGMLCYLLVLVSFLCRSLAYVNVLPGQVMTGRRLALRERDTPVVPRTRSTARFATVCSPPKTSSRSRDDADGLKSQPLPWSQSINPTRELTYMPMFKDQLEKLGGQNMKTLSIDERFVSRQSGVKSARIGSMCFQNEKYRKVRMTYFDGGDAVQVFNTVWYPSYEYDLPILGMDLISLGKSRVLSVIDFQPLHNTDAYSAQYIDHLSAIRDKYPDLHGTLSGKIYTDALFFSKQMLFGRMTDESKIMNTVFPAYQEYLTTYMSMMDRATPNYSHERMASVRARQSAYDAYNAIKDPAVGLYDAYFGKDWSDAFVHDFLFDHCREGDYSSAGSVAADATTSACSISSSSLTHDETSGAANSIRTSKPTMPQPVHNFRIDSTTGEIVINKPGVPTHAQ